MPIMVAAIVNGDPTAAFSIVTATNAETAVSGLVTVEYSGEDSHLSAGDFIYYPSGTTIVPNEITVIEAINHSANTFTAQLEQNHLADVEISKVEWCYPSPPTKLSLLPSA